MTCHGCGSYRHLIGACPYSYANVNKEQANITENTEKENVVLFTGYNRGEIQRLGEEAINCAVLDTACTSNVCGTKWYQCYIDSLPENEKDQIKTSEGYKVFKFGGGEQRKSKMFCQIPCRIAGKDVTIGVDVVESAIPLLLSLKALKTANTKLNLEQDTAEIFGTEVPLNFTSSGHYCIPIDKRDEVTMEEVYNIILNDLEPSNRKKAITKLHRKFAHPSLPRFRALMKDADIWKNEFQTVLDEIYNSCTTCKIWSKTPPRPVVSMPMASRFNEKVAMDLKSWKGKYILHMIDMFSRLSVSVFINHKTPKEVAEGILEHWIAAGWGVMEGLFFDNGGEFNNEEIREIASILDIGISSTPAESPWSNGLCERNHQITDRMLEILIDENPHVKEKTLLAWANVAKNSLQMWQGFSSYQLVLGKNPNLPNIMTEKLPAWQGVTTSEILKEHLDAMYSARKAFMKCEADGKIRQAMRHPIRTNEEIFYPGEIVFYKREGSNKWLGPGKVIFQDGRVVFVRHGGIYVRVSTNRLVKDQQQQKEENLREEKEQKRNPETRSLEKNGNSESSTNTNKTQMKEIIADKEQEDSRAVEDEDESHKSEESNTEEQRKSVYEFQPSPQEGIALEGENSLTPREVGKQHTVALRKDDLIEYKEPESNTWTEAIILGRAGKSHTATKFWYNIEEKESGEEKSVNLKDFDWRRIEENVNIINIPKSKPKDEYLNEKQAEIKRLDDYDAYQEEDDKGQTCISTTWVLTDKDGKKKARLCIRGFEESEALERDSPTVAKRTMRSMIAIAVSKGWKLKASDVKSAFLQGNDIQRDVFIKPPVEAKRREGKVWRLKKTLYGLVDAAKQFYNSVSEELINLGMKKSKVDPALFYRIKDGEVVGALITHIDDFMHCGNKWFDDNVIKQLTTRFQIGKQESENFRYIGFDIKQNDMEAVLEQEQYVNSLEAIEIKPERAKEKKSPLTTREQRDLRSTVGRCNWAAQGTRPDSGYDVVESSTKCKNGCVSDLIRANKNLIKLKAQKSFIKFPNLGPCQTWKIVVFSDAAFGNMSDGFSSVGGNVIFLVGENNKSAAVAWSCSKIKRVVKSTLSAEMLSLSEALDHAYALKVIISELTGLDADKIQVEAFVDNRSVRDAVYSAKSVKDKKLGIDVEAVKEMLAKKEVYKINWIPGEKMIANPLTKRGAACFDLLCALQNGELTVLKT